MSDAQRCVALDPETVAYRAALGKILFRVGQYEAAKHEFDCIYAGGIWALALRDMVGYTFDTTIAGEPLAMPESLERSWPFFYMLQHADSCRALQQKASRLLRGAFDISSWSADGKRLAYTRSEFCGWGDNALDMAGPAGAVRRRGIEILDLESGRIRVLVTFGGEPAWSPDGCLIAFVRSPGLLREAEEEVWLIPAEGGEPRRLADGGCPCWTNHPTRLYFHSRIHEALCCIDVNNPAKEPSEIVRCPALYPDVSPDERYVAYATAGELRVVELSTGEELVKWVVPGWDRLCRVRWSPDGREISLGIMGRQAPYSGLWIFDPERKKGWHILDGPATSCNWSRDHSRVAIDMMFPVSEIWLAQIDPNLPTWEALGPAQTRAEYLRDNWQECVAWTPWSSLAHRMQVLRNLTAVGVNQYESGEYEDALWTLQHVAEVRQTQGALPDLETTAYMAMTLERLGRSQEAQQALERLRTFRVKAESTGETYLYEAEIKAVFEGSEYSVPQQ